jgi:hypothetical protein
MELYPATPFLMRAHMRELDPIRLFILHVVDLCGGGIGAVLGVTTSRR